MRCVPVKSAAQQSVLVLHRARELLVQGRKRKQCAEARQGSCHELHSGPFFTLSSIAKGQGKSGPKP